MYSGKERLLGNIRAAYTYFKQSPKDDGAKLSYSPRYGDSAERLKGELNVTFPKNRRSHSGARAAAGRMQLPSL